MKSKLNVGLAWLGAVGVLVLGGLKMFGPTDVQEKVTELNKNTGQMVTRVVQSGAVTKVNGTTLHFIDTIPLVMTGGGVGLYDLAYICPDDYAITGSGLLLTAGIAMVNNPAAATFTIAYQNSPRTASSSLVLASAIRMPVASGSIVLKGTASGSTAVSNGSYSRWNGGQCIAVKTGTNPTTSGSGYLILEGMDDPSE